MLWNNKKNDNTQVSHEENTENTFSEMQKTDENEGNAEGNKSENIENIVVPEQNETKINAI